MAAPQTVKNAINGWMNTWGDNAMQGLNEVITQVLTKQLTPSAAAQVVDVAIAAGACISPLLKAGSALQIAGAGGAVAKGYSATKAVAGAPKPPARSDAALFQVYARKKLFTLRDRLTKRLHETADLRWTHFRVNPQTTGSNVTTEAGFLKHLMESTFKTEYIRPKTGDFNDNAMVRDIKIEIMKHYKRIKAEEDKARWKTLRESNTFGYRRR